MENEQRSTLQSVWSRKVREILGGENKSSVGAKSDQENMSPLDWTQY